MIEHVKKKLTKRELFERDGFTKHGKAKPYKRQPVPSALDDEAKIEFVQALLGEWELEPGLVDKEIE